MTDPHTEIKALYNMEGIPKEMRRSVDMLRTWLNEDRKCEPMVSSQEIWYWLKDGYDT